MPGTSPQGNGVSSWGRCKMGTVASQKKVPKRGSGKFFHRLHEWASHLSQVLHPPPLHPNPMGGPPTPSIPARKIPSIGEQVCTPGSTNRHTHSAFLAHPHPGLSGEFCSVDPFVLGWWSWFQTQELGQATEAVLLVTRANLTSRVLIGATNLWCVWCAGLQSRSGLWVWPLGQSW